MITFISIAATFWFLRGAGIAWEDTKKEKGIVQFVMFWVFALHAVLSGVIVAYAIKVNS